MTIQKQVQIHKSNCKLAMSECLVFRVTMMFIKISQEDAKIAWHCLHQRYSAAETRPGTGTWRSFCRDLKNLSISNLTNFYSDITKIIEFIQ